MEVTIIIPMLNRAATLRRVVESVPLQYPLILVDNGSRDETLALARKLCEERAAKIQELGATPRDVVTTEPVAGAPAARNCGLALCQTEWIYFFDSDDVFTSLPEISDTSAAACDMICFPVNMTVGDKERVRDYRPTADVSYHLLSAMLGTQSMLFRTSWLRSLGGWDNRCRIWNDWELGVRALLRRPRLLWHTTEARHHIFVHPDSITGASYSARSEAICDTLAVVAEEIAQTADRRVQRAFDLRCSIVSGVLRREHSTAAAERVAAMIRRPSLLTFLLRAFTAFGGRGAWRLALALL